MKRVLVITYYWPPSGGSGVQRWLKFAKYLPGNGWEPIVYTPLNPDVNAFDESLLKDVSPLLTVIKRRILEPYGFYKILSGKKKGSHIEANTVGASDSGGFLRRLSLYVRGNFFVPDPRCWWIGPSVRFLKKWLRENSVDAIVSTGPPHSMHLIAKELHRSLGIPWIADFRDPWTTLFYFKHLRLGAWALAKHKALEQSVLREATKVVVVSPAMRKEFAELSQRSDIELITNGFDPDDCDPVGNAALASAIERVKALCFNKFVIVHTGLMPQDANPDLFWEALGEIVAANPLFKSNLYIAVMGQTAASALDEIRAAGLEAALHSSGYVPHSEAIAWQKWANLLLLPLRKEKESVAILTGKFFEYLASGKPILAIGPVESDLGEAIRATGSGTMVEYNDNEGMKKAVNEAYTRFCAGRGTALSGEPALGSTAIKYSRPALAKQMAALLESVLPDKK